jgi:hypothetical protein
MTVKTEDYLTPAGVSTAIAIFKQAAHHFTFNPNIESKFRKCNKVLDIYEFQKHYKDLLPSLDRWYLAYYRIVDVEWGYVVQFLNDSLEIVCSVASVPEKSRF